MNDKNTDSKKLPEAGIHSDDLLNLMARMNKHLDDEEEYEAGQLFNKIFIIHDYKTDGNRKVGTLSCGSIGTQTVNALYRLFYLSQPKRVDFSDMYKSESLFALRSPDWQFVGDVHFYKYELAIYFSATGEYIDGQQHGIICGVPGIDNGINAKSESLTIWIALLKRCLDRKWMVYGGNDFEV